MNISEPTQHLTDAEFSDLLAGEEARGPVAAHLVQCDFCRTELESVSGSLNSFSSLSSQWAARVAPARVPVPSRLVLGLGMRPRWSTGLAVTALTGVLVFLYGSPAHRGAASVRETGAPPASLSAPSSAELANDNKLMQSIDQELAYVAQPAVSGSDLAGGMARSTQHSGAPVVN